MVEMLNMSDFQTSVVVFLKNKTLLKIAFLGNGSVGQ